MRSISTFLFIGVALLASGCMAHTTPQARSYNRLALVQPPTFDPQMLTHAQREPITTLAMEENYPAIEPAAGETARYLDGSIPGKSACRFGNIVAGEALSYGWDNARVGLGFDGSSVRSSEMGGAVLRFSIGFGPKTIYKKYNCDHAAAWQNFKEDVFE